MCATLLFHIGIPFDPFPLQPQDPTKMLAKLLHRCPAELTQTIITQIIDLESTAVANILEHDNTFQRYCFVSIKLYHKLLRNVMARFEGRKRLVGCLALFGGYVG